MAFAPAPACLVVAERRSESFDPAVTRHIAGLWDWRPRPIPEKIWKGCCEESRFDD
jgi:hypothetical protein